jgi:hypothetical protein
MNTEVISEMTQTKYHLHHTSVTTVVTNDPATIADDRHHMIAPTPKRAVRAAQETTRKTITDKENHSTRISEACRSKNNYKTFDKRYNVKVSSYHADNGAFHREPFQKEIDNKNQTLNFSGVNSQWKNGLVDRYNGTLFAATGLMLNHAISKWDKTIIAELWHFAIQHVATIFNTTKQRSRNYIESPWEKFTGKRSKLDQHDMYPLFCPVYTLDRKNARRYRPPPQWTKCTTQKVYGGHLHHYSKSVMMVWDPKTKLVSTQFHVMFDDNFDTVQPHDPNIKISDTMVACC